MGIFKAHIEAMSAYQPPLEGRNPDDYTLLDFNERTIPISAPIKQALIDYIETDRLQQYPFYGNICQRLANYCCVDENQVMLSNGSDQGIELIIRAAAQADGEIIIPQPSFAMYEQVAKVEGLKIVSPAYSRERGYPLEEVLAAITAATRVIVIANPNNPCGTLVDNAGIARIAEAAPEAAILIDECYYEYSAASCASLLTKYSNIVITRTFSKTWGLPSLRFGYLLSAPQNIQTLLNVRGPYDINQMAIVAASAALDSPEYTRTYVREVMDEAKPLLERFLDERGVDYWPSAANYLWAFPEQPEAMAEALAADGILVRPKADLNGRVGLRITVGTLAQTEQLIQAISGFLAK
ncbi:MAG: histidinol-phosphate aminotransferase family protein [Cellvibrionaceae bacterium]|nr:histidinol-phosphate aminotransferase family protein [Cellvibrionaceae bacterium]